MADPFIVSQLQRQTLFANLSDDQLQRIAEVSQVIQAQPGQYLFAQGQPVQAAQIFVSGRGALLSANAQGQSSQLGMVEAGQIINESAFFNSGMETASLRLLEPSVVIIIPREPVRQLMARDPALQANLRVLDASGGRDARKVLFRGQRSNETVYHLYHRHWWGFVRHAWIPVLLAGLFLVVSVIVDTRFPGIGLVFGCLTLTVPLFSLGFLLWEWRNDQLIITDQRLVSIHMQAWRLTRSVSGIPLDRIGEVNVDIPGGDIFANLFGYGTLVVRTTADRSGLTIRFMPDPSSVQKTVFEQRDLYQQLSQQMDNDDAQVRAQIAQALGMAPPGSMGQPDSEQDAMNEAEEVHFTAGKAGPPGFRTRFVTSSGVVCYRHHWIKWLRMQILPLFFFGLLLSCAGVSLAGLIELPLPILLPLAFVLALGLGVWLYLRDWDWRNDMMMIDTDTVIFQYKRPLWLQNQMEQIGLSKLDNVTSTVGGIVGNLFNVGTISMTMMGSSEQKTFRTIGDPESVVGGDHLAHAAHQGAGARGCAGQRTGRDRRVSAGLSPDDDRPGARRCATIHAVQPAGSADAAGASLCADGARDELSDTTRRARSDDAAGGRLPHAIHRATADTGQPVAREPDLPVARRVSGRQRRAAAGCTTRQSDSARQWSAPAQGAAPAPERPARLARVSRYTGQAWPSSPGRFASRQETAPRVRVEQVGPHPRPFSLREKGGEQAGDGVSPHHAGEGQG